MPGVASRQDVIIRVVLLASCRQRCTGLVGNVCPDPLDTLNTLWRWTPNAALPVGRNPATESVSDANFNFVLGTLDIKASCLHVIPW